MDLRKNRSFIISIKRLFFKKTFTFPLAFLFLTFLISAICLAASLSCGSSNSPVDNIQKLITGEPEIESMVLCKNVDEDFAPLEPADVFEAGTNSVYLSVKFNNFTEDDSVKVVWNYKTAGQEIATQIFTPGQAGSGYYSFNIMIADFFPPGDYSAAVYFNNSKIESLMFKIE